MGKLEMYALAGLAAFALITSAYFYGRSDGVALERAKWESASLQASERNMRELKAAVAKSSEISERTLGAVSNIRIINKTINNEVQREIKTDVRYAAECFPDSGRLLWNAASEGKLPGVSAGSEPVPAVRGPAQPAHR